MLVSFALGDANFLRRPCTFHFFCVDFMALGSQSEPHFQWNIGCVGHLMQIFCVGHIHFMLFMSISFASGTQRKHVFQWNMGFSTLLHCGKIGSLNRPSPQSSVEKGISWCVRCLNVQFIHSSSWD